MINLSPPEAAQGDQNRLMQETIARICAEQCQIAIRQYFNPSSDISGVDQAIEARYSNDLSDLDKVPDVVRSLREFSGNPAEFSSWKKSVDRILRLYESKKGTPKYFAILNTIRNKIIGNADAALESYNTPLNWDCISKCLTLHYADKRDLTTLEYQMTTLVQGNNKIQDFYQEVYSHLSLIMNKLSCMDISRESLDILSQTYRDKALDTFIRGLKGQMSIHLGMKEPKDLPQALQLCLKMENQVVRAQFANSHGHQAKINKHSVQLPPQLPPRAQYYPNTNTVFYPQLAYVPNTHPMQNIYQGPTMQARNFSNQLAQGQNFKNSNHFNPPRPTAPKPQPRPEPMDVDTSMRSRAVNYMNRPVNVNQFAGKRVTDQSEQVRTPQKMQRNYHLNTEEIQSQEPQHYEAELQNYEAQEGFVPLDDYVQNQYDVLENTDQSETQDFADIHFLD